MGTNLLEDRIERERFLGSKGVKEYRWFWDGLSQNQSPVIQEKQRANKRC